jgi:hypothetical protein
MAAICLRAGKGKWGDDTRCVRLSVTFFFLSIARAGEIYV